ncbi:Phosphoglucomutase/ phosphomannomutase [Chytriomyces sp. MP71]|nr:Phosphoglucomutase/ phosphomannomutase [Chytriomyces sp. MP71]
MKFPLVGSFGNLMDAGKLFFCSDESFGTGSDHIREKDGLWAVLAWLSILAYANTDQTNIGLHELLQQHYLKYDRNFFSHHDFEEVNGTAANQVIAHLRSVLAGAAFNAYTIAQCDDFAYTDRIDGSVSKSQGLRFVFMEGSRVVFRLSGTRSQGSRIRLYVEKFTGNSQLYGLECQEGIRDLIGAALEMSKLKEFTGREEPTVITETSHALSKVLKCIFQRA